MTYSAKREKRGGGDKTSEERGKPFNFKSGAAVLAPSGLATEATTGSTKASGATSGWSEL